MANENHSKVREIETNAATIAGKEITTRIAETVGKGIGTGTNGDKLEANFPKKEIELIAQNYNLEESASTEKTANYETNILTITPKFADRPTKRIFFARENGVILRVEDMDAEGVLREMFVYNRISFDPETVEGKWEVFQKEIKPEPRRSHSISIVEAEKMLKTKPIQPEYLPPGFQLQDVRSITSRENDSILLEYTDGLVNLHAV